MAHIDLMNDLPGIRGLMAFDPQAAFCMFNWYVDGLGTWAPEDQQIYKDRAPGIVEGGYTRPGQNT